VLLASILATGCTGLTNNFKASSPQPSPDPAQMPSLLVNQDSAWIESFQKYAPLIKLDAENMMTDSTSSDPNAKRNVASILVSNTREALNENDQCTVSPKYKEAQIEWEQTLEDLNLAGNSMLDIVNNIDAPSKVNDYTNYDTKMKSGYSHLKRAVTLFNAEAVSSIDLKTPQS